MKKFFLAFTVALLIPLQGALASTLPVRAYANDTVAGYSALLKSSLIAPGQAVTFVVEKPDLSVVRIAAQADQEGIAKGELYGLQTKVAGAYKVAIVYPGSADASPQSGFNVFADAVSSTQSTIRVAQALIKGDGQDNSFVTVTLYDGYRNPIIGHAVKLISSRSEDRIESLAAGVSDENGRATFKLSSLYPGLSVLTALDGTVNAILSDRQEVVFQEPAPVAKATGGALFQSNILGADIGGPTPDVATGPVTHFDIQGLPATAHANEELSFTVVAKDRDNNVAKNYTGTILLAAPNDDHAVLPSSGEYAFKETNQGQFTFNLALQFSALGHQALQVVDKSNWNIAGKAELDIVSAQAVTPSASASGTLKIKSPEDGSQLGNSLVVISGQGGSNINLKIFDHDAKIADSETDGDGFFSFETKNLENGPHSFYVMSDKGEVSNTVAVTIDTLPPVINALTISPDGSANPGQSLTVTVQSEPNLEAATVRVQGVETSLTPGTDAGTYQTSLTAPASAGRFPLDVILTDALGNKAELLNQRMIQVAVAEPQTPEAVKGLQGAAGDGVVHLSWGAASAPSAVAHYRVHYGTDFNHLDKTFDTSGNAAQADIPGLTNNTQTFFAVTAVNGQNAESADKGVTIAVTPVSAASAASAPASGYQAFPQDGGASLIWPAFPGVRALRYKVYFGLKRGTYDDFMVTPNLESRLTVPDLLNGVTYYFAVAALDGEDREISALSPEFSAVPGTVGLYGSAPTEPAFYSASLGRVPRNDSTGPEVFWVILSSLGAAAVVYSHKRRIIGR